MGGGITVDRDIHAGLGIGGQSSERGQGIPPIEKIEIRDATVATLRIAATQLHDLVRLVHRQVPQVPATDHREHGRVDAHAQRERHDHRGGEPPVPEEQSQRETQIVRDRVQGWQPTGVSMLVVKGCRATHPDQCGAPRLRGWHAATKIVLGEHREVRLQFLVEVAIEVAGSEGRKKARTPDLQGGQHLSPSRAELQQLPDDAGDTLPLARLRHQLLIA